MWTRNVLAVISIEKIGETEEGYIYEITFVDNNSYELIVPFGIDGTHGETPYIGSNGNWWIGNNDLGVKVTGEKGVQGLTVKMELMELMAKMELTE